MLVPVPTASTPDTRSSSPARVRALALLLALLTLGCPELPSAPRASPSAIEVAAVPPVDAAPPAPRFDRSTAVTDRALAVAATPDRLYVVRDDGQLLRWHAGGWRAPHVEPTPPLRDVESADRDVCALSRGGEVHCRTDGEPERAWGLVHGLGEVVSLAGSEVRFVKSDGESHRGPMWCAADRGGRVDCWVTPTPEAGAPVRKRIPGIARATVVAVGDDHACAIVEEGRLKCWHHLLAIEGSDDPGPRPRSVETVHDLPRFTGADGRCLHPVVGSLICLVAARTFRQAMSVGRGALFELFEGEEGARATRVRDVWGRRCRVFEGGRAICFAGSAAPDLVMADVEDLALTQGHACALRKDRTVDCHIAARR